MDWCPNGQTWTVAALLPSWILYPLTCRVIALIERAGGVHGLFALAVALWCISFGPLLAVFAWQEYWITIEQGVWSYVWPVSQLPDFALGAVAAALAIRHTSNEQQDAGSSQAGYSSARGFIADACVAVILVTCFVTPSSGLREGWEPLFNHGFALVLALFLYGSAAQGGAGLIARLLSHDALVGFGDYSFEVYLFQYPVHEIFVAAGDLTGAFTMRNASGTHNTNSCGFMAFFLALWLSAGLYAEYVESRLVRWLRADGGGRCIDPPAGEAANDVRLYESMAGTVTEPVPYGRV